MAQGLMPPIPLQGLSKARKLKIPPAPPHVRAALSTWFRVDTDKTLMKIETPLDHARIWIKTLDIIREWGELDNILYVDFCNEWLLDVWAPFFTQQYGSQGIVGKDSVPWMKAVLAEFKRHYPQIPATFSFCHSVQDTEDDVSFLDFIEQHIWMTTGSDFYERVG